MKLEEIRAMVEKDLQLNETELDTESMRVPQIHGKYLNLMFDERLMLMGEMTGKTREEIANDRETARFAYLPLAHIYEVIVFLLSVEYGTSSDVY